MRRKKKWRWVRGRWWRWRAVGSRSMRGEGREVSIASHSGGGWEDRWMENRTRNKVHVRINGAYMLYDSKWGRPRRRAVLKQNICVRISMLRRSGPPAFHHKPARKQHGSCTPMHQKNALMVQHATERTKPPPMPACLFSSPFRP